jgi:hypothetical protein
MSLQEEEIVSMSRMEKDKRLQELKREADLLNKHLEDLTIPRILYKEKYFNFINALVTAYNVRGFITYSYNNMLSLLDEGEISGEETIKILVNKQLLIKKRLSPVSFGYCLNVDYLRRYNEKQNLLFI